MKNIGILFPASRKMGIFQYSCTIAEALAKEPDFTVTILYFEPENPKEFLSIQNTVKVKYIPLDASANSFLGKLKFLANCLMRRPLFITNEKNAKALENSRIDLLVQPLPLLFGFEHKVPYVVVIPDIMHKYYPTFPEYDLKTRIKRDFVYGIASQNAVLNVTESTAGAKDLEKFYGITLPDIRPIYLLPPAYVYEHKNMDETEVSATLNRFMLPSKFFFYPAQFWFHKNHLRLIKALHLAKKNHGQEISLVLAGNPGANKKNYDQVMKLVKELGLEKQVIPLGYVSDKEVVALYKKSIGLVFPTLIGPTSIPPLEAMVLGTPVLCSNLFSMPDQVGDAGVLFNPFDENDMAEKISQVWKDENTRKKMSEAGLRRAESISAEKYGREWVAVIKEALNKITL